MVNPRDQHAWQLANELTWRVWSSTASFLDGEDGLNCRDRARASARLTATAVAKGFERNDQGQRLRFFAVALSAADDTRGHLTQAVDRGLLRPAEFELVLDLLRRTSVAIRVLVAAERQAPVMLPGRVRGPSAGSRPAAGLDPPPHQPRSAAAPTPPPSVREASLAR